MGKNFFVNYECYDLANDKECVRFGGHVDIQDLIIINTK
jgi:hypothetical protein